MSFNQFECFTPDNECSAQNKRLQRCPSLLRVTSSLEQSAANRTLSQIRIYPKHIPLKRICIAKAYFLLDTRLAVTGTIFTGYQHQLYCKLTSTPRTFPPAVSGALVPVKIKPMFPRSVILPGVCPNPSVGV